MHVYTKPPIATALNNSTLNYSMLQSTDYNSYGYYAELKLTRVQTPNAQSHSNDTHAPTYAVTLMHILNAYAHVCSWRLASPRTMLRRRLRTACAHVCTYSN